MAEAPSFIHIPPPVPDAFVEIPLLFDEVVSFPVPFPGPTTDIDFGSGPGEFSEPGTLDAFLRNLDPSESIFLLIGISLFAAGLRIPIPSLHPGRYRPQYSSQSRQIIHLTRPQRLP
jgi:hypothetical protein